MAKEAFRLVRMLPSGAFEYLASVEGDSFVWTDDPMEAKLFESWKDWVAAAHAYWLTSGPVDIFYEQIYSIHWRALGYA